jgi:hypothetical protein
VCCTSILTVFFSFRKRKDNKGTRNPQVDDEFWSDTRVYSSPGNAYPLWTGNHWNQVSNGQVTSCTQTVEILKEWMKGDVKAVDLDVKFPRLERIEAMEHYITAHKNGFDNHDVPVRVCGQEVSKEWLSSWRLKLRTEYEFYTTEEEAKEASKDGLTRLPGKLYRRWASKSDEKKKTGQKDDNSKTHSKMIDWYKAHPEYESLKPEVSSLEMTYILLVQAHVDPATGKHKGRDSTFDLLRAGKSDTITKEIVATFISNCPKCSDRSGGTRAKTAVAVKSEPDQTSPSKKRKTEAANTPSSKRFRVSNNNTPTSGGNAEEELPSYNSDDFKLVQQPAGHSYTAASFGFQQSTADYEQLRLQIALQETAIAIQESDIALQQSAVASQQPDSYLPYTELTVDLYEAAGQEFDATLYAAEQTFDALPNGQPWDELLAAGLS